MAQSHESMRDDFEITVPEIDYLVELAQSAIGNSGGARMTGGGFVAVLLSHHTRKWNQYAKSSLKTIKNRPA